jgi:hypothetical protein
MKIKTIAAALLLTFTFAPASKAWVACGGGYRGGCYGGGYYRGGYGYGGCGAYPWIALGVGAVAALAPIVAPPVYVTPPAYVPAPQPQVINNYYSR